MTIRVIGAGFGRTGTTSLKVALEKLGICPCYHMEDASLNPHHATLWRDAVIVWSKRELPEGLPLTNP